MYFDVIHIERYQQNNHFVSKKVLIWQLNINISKHGNVLKYKKRPKIGLRVPNFGTAKRLDR